MFWETWETNKPKPNSNKKLVKFRGFENLDGQISWKEPIPLLWSPELCVLRTFLLCPALSWWATFPIHRTSWWIFFFLISPMPLFHLEMGLITLPRRPLSFAVSFPSASWAAGDSILFFSFYISGAVGGGRWNPEAKSCCMLGNCANLSHIPRPRLIPERLEWSICKPGSQESHPLKNVFTSSSGSGFRQPASMSPLPTRVMEVFLGGKQN